MDNRSTQRLGVILAGGAGSRLSPVTKAVSKQLLPIYDKPMIYYSICVLVLSGIHEIVVITTPNDQEQYQRLLGNGDQWGLRFHYAVQERPSGIAEAVIIAEQFAAGRSLALILGDNFFFGAGLIDALSEAAGRSSGAVIFCKQVSNPGQYGVVELDRQGRAVSIEEKPDPPLSDLAIPGLYFYDDKAYAHARALTPSSRGELEITDLNRLYLTGCELHVQPLGRGIAWMDAGTPADLADASQFVRTIEQRQGLKIGCPEEVAWRRGLIDTKQLEKLAQDHSQPDYRKYLLGLAEDVHAHP